MLGTLLLTVPLAVAGESGCLGISVSAETEVVVRADAAPVAPDDPAVAAIRQSIERMAPPLGLEADSFVLTMTESVGSPELRFDCHGEGFELRVPLPFARSVLAAEASGLVYVIGHELGHLAMLRAAPQVKARLCADEPLALKPIELLADFASGYAFSLTMPRSERAAPTPKSRDPVIATIIQVSDYAFSDATHHGRISERTSAFGLGASSALFHGYLDLGQLARRLQHFEHTLFTPTQGRQAAAIDHREALRRLYE